MLYKSYNTIGSNFSFKDKTPVDCLSNVVYKYTCECCKASYIGKTELQFRCRICQHLGISARTGAELGVKVASEIREHSLKCKTHINVDNFTILDTLQSNKGILILESLHQKILKTIYRYPPTIYTFIMFRLIVTPPSPSLFCFVFSL